MPSTSRKLFHNKGFTLLELLVIVAILAIVAGALLVAYDDVDDTVSEGVAANTLANLDQAVRSYTAISRQAPNFLDSLLVADYPGNTSTPVTATSANYVAILPKKISDKSDIYTLSQAQASALINAGITHLRWVDPAGNVYDPSEPPSTQVTLGCPDADGSPNAVVGPMAYIDIPDRIFESPRPGGKNRGHGFLGAVGDQTPVLRWINSRSGGPGGYDATKLAADKDDVLIMFGLGNDASIVGATHGRAQLSSAPVFGKKQKYEYGRYILLYNLGPDPLIGVPFSKARLQVVLNTHGDFVDEMISEFSGQKG